MLLRLVLTKNLPSAAIYGSHSYAEDDEEERVSKDSADALPYRLRVRQAADKYAGNRKTKPPPPEKKMTDHCAFVLLMTKYQEEQQLCVES